MAFVDLAASNIGCMHGIVRPVFIICVWCGPASPFPIVQLAYTISIDKSQPPLQLGWGASALNRPGHAPLRKTNNNGVGQHDPARPRSQVTPAHPPTRRRRLNRVLLLHVSAMIKMPHILSNISFPASEPTLLHGVNTGESLN